MPQEALCTCSEHYSVLREMITLRGDEDEVLEPEIEHRARHRADVSVEEGVDELEQAHAAWA